MSLSFDATAEELKLFLEEAEEQLQLLDEDLIKLESDGANPDLLQEIFRAAHTLKGSSATIGHQRMAQLTHAMETVLDKLRKGTVSVETQIINTLLESLDALRVLTSEVESLKQSSLDITGVVAKLAATGIASAGSVGKSSSETLLTLSDNENALLSSSDDDTHSYRLDVQVDEDSPLMAARHFQVLIELGALGEVVKSSPSAEEIESEQVGPKLALVMTSQADPKTIKDLVASISDIKSVDVRDYAPASAKDTSAHPSKPETKAPATSKAASNPERAEAGAAQAKLSKTVRIDVERLDNLMNLVGELVIERTRLQQIGASLEMSSSDDVTVARLLEASQHVGRITNELQEEIMKSRMLPIENVFNKFPRMVRDLAVKSGKQINFVVEGQETELDRSVIEQIGDPLIHLLRNSIDHGIESPEDRERAGKSPAGTIRLSAFHQENHIVIMVEDDGKGIDPQVLKAAAVAKKLISQEMADRMGEMQAIELIFQSGFSMAKKVSDVSGRGVGMDIVKTNVERLNGFITTESHPGSGTKFIITLPLTLAIIQALLVSVGKRICAIPLVSVLETVRLDKSSVKSINGREAVTLRGNVLPLIRFSTVFHDVDGVGGDSLLIVATKFGDKQVGLVVDSLVGQQEIVIKPLGRLLGDIRGLSGATILGDGRVALIIDVAALIRELIREQTGAAESGTALLAS
ncbi:MAG: chemotaxis protein CheA [Chloroflexi bacterium]|nr:chemotaxis protein CheA [Chloroflexota bacterium]